MFAVGLLLTAGAARADANAELKAQIDELKPGLGEIMGVIRQHHAKLYFAGSAANWDLAAYQVDEIREGFDDVVKYHAHFKDVQTPLSDLVPRLLVPSLDAVAQSLKRKDKAGFRKSFDALTAGCNACHRAAGHPFIVIQTPATNEFSNQRFAP